VAALPQEIEREYAYILGEAFQGREILEYKKDFLGPDFFALPDAEKYFNILLKWCPEKIFDLLGWSLYKYSKRS
jgi:hypothetical protein